MFSPLEEVVCSPDCITCNPSFSTWYQVHFTKQLVTLHSWAKQPNAFVSLNQQWPAHGQILGTKVSLWGGRCQSLSHVGHKLLSLQWWISFPRLLINISELNGFFFFFSSASQPVASRSQYYKVSFVSSWQHGTLGSIHMSPHGNRFQRTAQPWRCFKALAELYW